MKWIGITGGIATGKSTVTKMLQDLGAEVVDADVLAREVVAKDSFGLRALVEVFGEGILSTSGQLDRSKMAKIIFQDPVARASLENIVHPLIQWRSLQERRLLAKKGLKVAFYDAALIFEKGLQNRFDAVVVVNASMETQKKRLIQRDEISGPEAERRLAAQWPMAKKIELAQFVINNDAEKKTTQTQIEALYKNLTS